MFEAATQRMRPMLMTALSAAIGLFPAALSTGIGSQVQRPLAAVVVGGMLIGPVMLLIVVPALRLLVLGAGRTGDEQHREGGEAGDNPAAHYAFSIGLAAARAGAKPPPFRTGSLMLCGKGSGRSKTLSAGIRMTKWKKYQKVAMRAITT